MFNALNATLHAHRKPSVSFDAFKSFYGFGMRNILQKALASVGVPVPDNVFLAYFDEYVLRYSKQTPDPSQIYPHVAEMLGMLQSAGVKLGICTLKPEEATLWILDQLDLKRYFSFIGGGDTFPYQKPDPRHLLSIIEQLALSPAECLMIGDRSNDLAMARGAGIPCLLVDHDGENDTMGADGVLGGFENFEEALAKARFKIR